MTFFYVIALSAMIHARLRLMVRPCSQPWTALLRPHGSPVLYKRRFSNGPLLSHNYPKVPLLINGEFIESQSSDLYPVINPVMQKSFFSMPLLFHIMPDFSFSSFRHRKKSFRWCLRLRKQSC